MATTAPPVTGPTTPQDPPQPIAPPVSPPVVTPPAPAPAQQSLPIVSAPAEVPGLDDDDRKDGIDVTDNRLTVPVSAFKRIKDRASSAARKEAETSIFRELGVDSLDAAKALITKSKETPVPDPVVPAAPVAPAVTPAVTPPAAAAPPPAAVVAPPPAPAAATTPEERQLPTAMRDKFRADREAAEAKAAKAEADATAARAALVAKDQEIAVMKEHTRLRETLISSGCTEVDFTFAKMQEHMRTLDDEKLKAFDPKAWAVELKTSKPFLFGATVALANTGGGAGPKPPGPGEVNAGAGQGGARDFRTMTDAERRSALPPGIKLPPGSRTRPSK